MPVNATLNPRNTFSITVKRQGDAISALRPITVKNQINEISSVDDIPGVNTSLRVDGATLVYDANTNQYYVKKLGGAGINAFSYSASNNTLIITDGIGTQFFATINSTNNFTITGNTSIYNTKDIVIDEGEF